jgi:hypothetical protein
VRKKESAKDKARSNMWVSFLQHGRKRIFVLTVVRVSNLQVGER